MKISAGLISGLICLALMIFINGWFCQEDTGVIEPDRHIGGVTGPNRHIGEGVNENFSSLMIDRPEIDIPNKESVPRNKIFEIDYMGYDVNGQSVDLKISLSIDGEVQLLIDDLKDSSEANIEHIVEEAQNRLRTVVTLPDGEILLTTRESFFTDGWHSKVGGRFGPPVPYNSRRGHEGDVAIDFSLLPFMGNIPIDSTVEDLESFSISIGVVREVDSGKQIFGEFKLGDIPKLQKKVTDHLSKLNRN